MATKLKDIPTVQDALNELPEPTLYSALALAFAEIESATKAATNPHFKSKYADIGKVIDAIKPALISHGLFFTQRSHPADNGVIVETVVSHRNGEELSLGKLFLPSARMDAQSFGSALTYARRYALLTAFGVPTEDDDGEGSGRREEDQNNRPTTGETPPKKRVELKSLDGTNPPPYPFITHLMTAARQFVHTLEGISDMAEFIPWSKTDEVKGFVAQCKRDLPGWWAGGDGAPDDWVPLEVQVNRKKRELEELESIRR